MAASGPPLPPRLDLHPKSPSSKGQLEVVSGALVWGGQVAPVHPWGPQSGWMPRGAGQAPILCIHLQMPSDIHTSKASFLLLSLAHPTSLAFWLLLQHPRHALPQGLCTSYSLCLDLLSQGSLSHPLLREAFPDHLLKIAPPWGFPGLPWWLRQ